MKNLIKADLYRASKSNLIYLAFVFAIAINVLTFLIEEPVIDTQVISAGANVLYGPDVIDGYYVSCGPEIKPNYYIDEAINNGYEPSDDYAPDDIDVFLASLPTGRRYTYTLHIISHGSNLFYPLIMIVFAFLASDISGRTANNTLSGCVSKRKYMLSKLAVILIISALLLVLSNLFSFLLTHLLDMAMSPSHINTEPIGSVLKMTLFQLPAFLAAASMLTLLAIAVKKSAFFVAAALPLMLGFQMFVHSLLWGFKLDLLRVFLWKYEFQIMMQWLTYFPPAKYVVTCAVMCIAETVAAAALSCFILQKSELK